MKEFHSAATINTSPEAICQILTDASHTRTGSREQSESRAVSFSERRSRFSQNSVQIALFQSRSLSSSQNNA
jgi:hypothetical protein